MMKEEEALASGNITCHEAKFEGCYYCSCYYSKAKLLLYYVCVVAAFSKFLASMALKDVVQTLPAKIIYLENLMLEPMNCAMKTVA